MRENPTTVIKYSRIHQKKRKKTRSKYIWKVTSKKLNTLEFLITGEVRISGAGWEFFENRMLLATNITYFFFYKIRKAIRNATKKL